MRPTYENAKTRKTEEFFLFLFPVYHKVPVYYGFDFMRAGAWEVSIAELKCRNYTRDEVPDGELLLSVHKVNTMQNFRAHDRWLMFLLNDGLWRIPVAEYVTYEMRASEDPTGPYIRTPQPVIYFEGRRDRNDWQDQEPCYRYRVKDLEQVKSKEEIVAAWEIFNGNRSQG